MGKNMWTIIIVIIILVVLVVTFNIWYPMIVGGINNMNTAISATGTSTNVKNSTESTTVVLPGTAAVPTLPAPIATATGTTTTNTSSAAVSPTTVTTGDGTVTTGDGTVVTTTPEGTYPPGTTTSGDVVQYKEISPGQWAWITVA